MDARQLRELIAHILKEADLYHENAVELLMLTAAKESSLGFYIKQLGGGPARGIFQMEPETEKDLWKSYLDYRPEREETIKRFDSSDKDDLWFNIGYQILLCRVHYLRVPDPLPDKSDIIAMAKYWKKFYNTELGAGTVQGAVDAYLRYC